MFRRLFITFPFVAFPFAFWESLGSCAQSIELPAVADTTLIEYAPSNNMGGHAWLNAGSTYSVTAPGSNLPSRNRALLLFDVSAIPIGAMILRAEMHCEVTGEPIPGNGTSSLFGLHRLLRAWGEGDKVSAPGSPGLGRLATASEATWTSPLALGEMVWASPGGAPDLDYVAVASTTQFIEDATDYVFGSTSETIADVQLWVDSGARNFGWMLRSHAEENRGTARRFGSREDDNNVARLFVEFQPPLRIDAIAVTAEQLEIRFAGKTGEEYEVYYASELASSEWRLLRNVGPLQEDFEIVITDAISEPARFYRVARTP